MSKTVRQKRTRTNSGGPKKARRGRRPFEVTQQSRNIVRLMACAGVLPAAIAEALGCGTRTLQRHYRSELANATPWLLAQAVGTLVRALRGSDRAAVTSAIFVLKTRSGGFWSERQEAPADQTDNELHVHLPAGFELPAGHPLQPFSVVDGGRKP